MRIAAGLVLTALIASLPQWAIAQVDAPVNASNSKVRQDGPPVQEARPILPRLNGLRFIDSPSKLRKPQELKSEVSVDGPYLLFRPGIYQRLQQFIGKPFSHATMNEITTVVAHWYRAHNHPFVDVTFPPQDISGGVIQVIVTEFHVGRVRVRGNNWFSSDLLSSSLHLETGDRIDSTVLDRNVAALNQNPYLQVNVVAEKSDVAGDTDLVLETHDRLPLRFFAGYSNGGLPILGRDNWSVGFDWGNAFWLDQDLSYQFTSSDDFWSRPGDIGVGPGQATLAEHQLSYAVPLPWHDRFLVFGNYVQAEPRIGPFFLQTGVSWQVSARYVISLPTTDTLQQDLQLGFDFKRTNNNLEFGGFGISNSSTEIDQFPIIYDETIDDRFGRTVLFDELVFSPGGLSGRNNDSAFQPSTSQIGVPYAHANYVYVDASLARLTRLPYNASWLFHLQSQISDSNLLASEQQGLGGIESVRGYDERAINGPIDVSFSNEIRAPDFGVLDPLLGTKLNDKLQADIFWDFGYVREKKYVPVAQNSAMIQSVGAGLHYTIDRFVELHFEYGWQLRRAPGAASRGSEAYLSVVVGN